MFDLSNYRVYQYYEMFKNTMKVPEAICLTKNNVLEEDNCQQYDDIDHKLQNKNKKYQKKDKSRIDLVLAADNEEDNYKIQERHNFFKVLRNKRLNISKKAILSFDKKTKFWIVYTPFDVLCDAAEDLKLHLPTVQDDIEINLWYSKALKKLRACWDRYDPFAIRNSYFNKSKFYFADVFDKSRLCEFYNGNNKNKLFSQAYRSLITYHILQTTSWCSDFRIKCGLSYLMHNNVFTDCYPVHDGVILKGSNLKPVSTKQKLYEEWGSFKQIFKYQPIDAIKDYFGVKIAFYFDWLGFYTLFLIPVSLLGILCCLYGGLSLMWFEPTKEICSQKKNFHFYMCPLCDKDCNYFYLDETCLYARIAHVFDNSATPMLSVFMSLWSVLYLEYWKRRQYTLSYKWHSKNFYEVETLRPEYCEAAVQKRVNPVTKETEPFISTKDYFFKVCGELSVVFLFMCLVIAATMGVIVYRGAVFILKAHSNSKLLVACSASVISLIIINVLRILYKRIAKKLTEWENPRTKSDFEKSFTFKMFWFQFCNAYSSVFYIAFFKNAYFVGWPGDRKYFINRNISLEGCSAQGCFLELSIQLVVLMAGQQLIGNIPEFVLPFLKKKYNSWKHLIANKNVPIYENDYQLNRIEKHNELFLYGEYEEVVLQYGFVTMFIAAFPLAPLIALVTNLIEIRIDAKKLITQFRRPIPMLDKGIGVWYNILVTVTAFSVMVNGCVIALTSEFIPRIVYKYKYSSDHSLNGYLNWSLSYYNVTNFKEYEKPLQTPLHPICRFAGFHDSKSPYDFNKTHWEVWTVRLTFVFIFQFVISGTSRLLAWFIPDRPTSLCLKIRRQQHLAKEAEKLYKIKIRKRMPDINVHGDGASELDLNLML
ncbi:anoctamin-3 isoform X2 [Hydra vulgaris]|uniref:Anoctamin n=1 Tax=Hydra vulgaris TaxID=6087 RepID=A0ABM4DES0_HYDVU